MSKLFTYVCVVVAVVGMTSLLGMADEGSHKGSPNSHHQERKGWWWRRAERLR